MIARSGLRHGYLGVEIIELNKSKTTHHNFEYNDHTAISFLKYTGLNKLSVCVINI